MATSWFSIVRKKSRYLAIRGFQLPLLVGTSQTSIYFWENGLKQHIVASLTEAQAALESLLSSADGLGSIESAAALLIQVFSQRGRVYACGNGGSMCDAMHFAEELTGRYRLDRGALAATAISDAGHLTCMGNDLGTSRFFPATSKHMAVRETVW